MMKLEDICAGASITGVLDDSPVTVIAVTRHGDMGLTLTYETAAGALDRTMLFRDDEDRLSLAGETKWTFDADPDALKLASEAYRIELAHLFDPYLAVRTSAIDPLPHQVSAVYKDMLPKMPLRFVLADDPGAGKTIMTGLLIKEMIARGDLKRCLIVCPGNLVEQWQDELYRKFGLSFTILTNDLFEAAVTRNAFVENDLCIARLDKLSRNDGIRERLKETSWDLVVCDEAHKMSATVFGGEVKYTKRYQLGQLLGDTAENLLLLTATPHNGKPEDFQLFMALVDRDRFEGARRMKPKKASGGSQTSLFNAGRALPGADADQSVLDVSDVMRRLVKEELLRFDGRPLFPERRAQTVTYTLSPAEAGLYQAVTDYVTNEFNRADRLDGKQKNSVGFALTILQRRLASSPEAIYQSLRRRRERLEARLLEVNDKAQGVGSYSSVCGGLGEDFDEDDYTFEELENLENDVIDSASASASKAELEAEIGTLKLLERKANEVRMGGEDRKWDELSRLLQDNASMFSEDGRREKLIIFTEHKDTLEYLATKIRQLLGSHEAVLTIKGGMPRDARHRAEELFKQDSAVRILVATDAAGEGINLQRAHLMVNYDLPWNPNRIEQRFGRIHRIGQTEVCHLWNLVAKETREGQVFDRLFQKLEEERAALGGRVFDILGRVTFEDKPLRDLLVEAIRYGDRPDVRDRLNQVVDSSLDVSALKALLDEYALTADVMDVHQVIRIKEDMERMEAHKLEPHFIEAFFLEAMRKLGGRVIEREKGRYEVLEVPFSVRSRDMKIGAADPVLRSYERVCFDKMRCASVGGVPAVLVCPGHPLLDATVSAVLEQGLGVLRQGSVLVDDDPSCNVPRLLFYVESSIQDGTVAVDGTRRTVSRAVHFVEMDCEGSAFNAGYAPYLDYRAPTEGELAYVDALAGDVSWLGRDPEGVATEYAIRNILPAHVDEIRARTHSHVDKVRRAVEKRLRAEIRYWDKRAWELKERENSGKKNARLNSAQAEKRANELDERLRRRLAQLDAQRQLSPAPPRVVGGALVLPAALLRGDAGGESGRNGSDGEAKRRVELAAMKAVMAIERELGYEPCDVSARRKIGYDIESSVPEGAHKGEDPVLRMIEVKGRASGSNSVTLSKNEVLCALNKPDGWLLAVVEVDGDVTHTTYLHKPAFHAPAFAENSINFDIGRLCESAEVVLERTDQWQ
ncbi:helicase-related protein [Adlercreutzia sp. ZJ242]|uniref:helicase-related protein n=1 Tax=Adlercreutzia sp. ZJ242 TaxID=2709409 RepID=UPI0013EC6219|nr:helicase-related protein [Adlercreutzia sp. ZJ242]